MIDQRVHQLEKRVSSDSHFKNERIQKIESDLSSRVAQLEMQVSQLKAELRVKDEMIRIGMQSRRFQDTTPSIPSGFDELLDPF